MKIKLGVDGMSCDHCVKHVTEALSEIDGATNVNVSLKEKTAIVDFENEFSESTVKAILEDNGFELSSVTKM